MKSAEEPSAVPRRSGSRRRMSIASALALAFIAILGIARVELVHSATRDWRLWQAAAPTMLIFDGSHYLRADSPGAPAAPLGPTVPGGQTDGGGQIAVPAANAAAGLPAAGWLVVTADSVQYGYAMMGGG